MSKLFKRNFSFNDGNLFLLTDLKMLSKLFTHNKKYHTFFCLGILI